MLKYKNSHQFTRHSLSPDSGISDVSTLKSRVNHTNKIINNLIFNSFRIYKSNFTLEFKVDATCC